MLKIQPEQMEVFKQAAIKSFETNMVAHCNNFSPQLCKVIGEEQLRIAIRQAIVKSQSYGFTNKGPVRLFVEMVLLFGSAFDTDPQYPWAAEILKSYHSDFQTQRAQQLYEKTLDYLEKVVGPKDIFTRQALERISVLARQQPSFSQKNFTTDMLNKTTYIYPEKAAFIGDSALELLIQEAVNEATTNSMIETHRMALFYVLMFAFGHGCTNDPLYPWIARTLRDEKIVGPMARSKRLEKKALTWLDHVIAAFSKGA